MMVGVNLIFFIARMILIVLLYGLTIALASWLGVPMGHGVKRVLNGAAGAFTLHGMIQPAVSRCFFYSGHRTRLASWVMATFNIDADALGGAISLRWWFSLLIGIGAFVVGLLLKSP